MYEDDDELAGITSAEVETAAAEAEDVEDGLGVELLRLS